MARVQGMTPEGIRKAIAEAIAFIKDLNVEDLNKLLAAFEDANGIFDVRLVEAQEEVKKAGEKALEAEKQAKLIVEELARYQELQDAEAKRILSEVATAIEAANLASENLPSIFQRLTDAEAGLSFANTEFDTLIVKQDELRDTVTEQTAEVSRLNTEFVAVNQTVADAVDKVDQSTIKVNKIGGDLELAKAALDAKIKQNQDNIAAAQIVVDEHQNAIETLTGDLGDLSTQHSTLASNFSTEVQNLKAADASQVDSISSLMANVDTKVGELRGITDAQSGEITSAKSAALIANSQAAAAHQRLIETVYPDQLSLVPMVPGGVNVGTEEDPVYRQEPSWRHGATTTTVIEVPEMTDNVAATYSEYNVYETTTKNTVPVRTQEVGFSVWVNASAENSHMVFTLVDSANAECVEQTIIHEGPLAGTHWGCVIDTRQTSTLPVGWTKLEGVITLKAGVKALRTEYIYFNIPHNDSVVATQSFADLKMWPMIPAQSDVNEALTKAIDSHAALFEGQNKWNDVATAAIESQATLLAKQARWSEGVDKALAWQDQLNNSQSDINRTTSSVLANQEKWNAAQAQINDNQSDINKATQSVLLNQSKWNTAQEKVNNDQSELNKAVKVVQDKQTAWNDGVTKALASHTELFKTTSKTFKAVKAVNDNQTKWNKVVSDLVTTNNAVSRANKTAIEGLTRVLGLTHGSSNVVPMVPGGVRTGGTDLAPIFTQMPSWMENVKRVTVTAIPDIPSILAAQETRQTTIQSGYYLSEVDPTIEYKYSYWIRANVPGTVIYIEIRDQDGEHAVLSNKPDNHYSEGRYLAGNVPVGTVWAKYTGVIKFNPNVRYVRIAGIYYNHAKGATGTQTLADIQIYPNIPSQADVNKALTDSDAAQNTLLKKQGEWNDAASRSIATVESLWGKTSTEVGELNTLSKELSKRITDQGKDFSKNMSEMLTNIPQVAYAVDGSNVSLSDTDGFIEIVRTKSGNRTTRVIVVAGGTWVGSMIVEADHGRSDGTNQTFFNWTPIGRKFNVVSGTRIFTLNRNTNVDHIGAVKVTYFVSPGQVVPVYSRGTNVYPDPGTWKTLHSYVAPETSDYTISLNVTWGATTYNDDYGVRIRAGSKTVAEIKKNRVGPLLPGQGGVRSMPIGIGSVRVTSGTRIYLEAYSKAGDSLQRRIAEWDGEISHITSGRG